MPFSVSRSNLWASQDDVTLDPAEDLAFAADSLVNNEFEEVKIDDVTFGSDMSTAFQQLHITKLEVMVAGGKYTSAKTVRVKAGTKLRIRVSTRLYRSTTTTVSALAVVVPKRAKGSSGDLTVAGGTELADGGGGLGECLFEPELCADGDEGSLDAVIKGITATPKNNAILAQLDLESDDSDAPQTVTTTKHRGYTVAGERSISILVS